MDKVKVGVLGTGKIAIDLLMKIIRSEYLECAIFIGRNYESEGIKIAIDKNIPVAYNSIQYLIDNPDCCEIVFDATTAKAHLYHAPVLKKLKKFVVDLTPSGVGQICVPTLNVAECLEHENVNMVTCAGQATIPLIEAILRVHPETTYIEIVTSAASKSVGMGSRENLDEFNHITGNAIKKLTGAPNVKIIVSINPADPPINMHNTIYAIIKDPDITRLKDEVLKVVNVIQEFVPGYSLVLEPIYESGRVTLMVGVKGLGDYLPKYAGNHDIINCAALNIAERYAQSLTARIRPSVNLARYSKVR